MSALPGPADTSPARGRVRILATHEKGHHPKWLERVVLLPGWEQEYKRTWRRPEAYSWRNDLAWAWRLFRASRDFDVVVTGSERPSLLFALLQKFLRRRRVPHIFIECLWNLPEAPRWRRALKRRFFRAVASAASRVVVHSEHQVAAYARALRLPPEKFAFVRCQITLYDAHYQVSEGDYIFAGGDSNRDYRTLVEAVRGLPYRVVIAALFRHHFEGLEIPPNVQIVTVDAEAFNQLVAGAAVIAVPLKGGLLHSGGHQGFENAMTIGKPVVVADDCGAENYVTHGRTGMLVPPGDPAALRAALLAVLEDREFARQLARNAQAASAAFAPERFFESVFALVDEIVGRKS